jgi:hypothetical protein
LNREKQNLKKNEVFIDFPLQLQLKHQNSKEEADFDKEKGAVEDARVAKWSKN